MGVLERWRKTRADRRQKELSALDAYRQARKDYREAKAARQAADRVIKRHSTTSASLAVKYAQRWVGTVEDPGRPNRGKQVDVWNRMVDMLGQPWCGAFMYAALKHAGVQGLSIRMRYVPYLLADAHDHVNGFSRVVSLAEAKPGDLLVFQWDSGPVDHVGMFVGRDKNGGVLTVEGNTASGNQGDQSNGGGVWNRTRDPRFIAAVVRPRYPA